MWHRRSKYKLRLAVRRSADDGDSSPSNLAAASGGSRPARVADVDLVRRALNNEETAVEDFLARMDCIGGFVTAINRRCGRLLDDESLRDVAQDVLAAVWCKLGSYRGEASLETWVYRFCELRVRSVVRRAAVRRMVSLDGDVIDPRDVVENPDGDYVVDRTLDALSPLDASILRLKLLDALTFEAIAVRVSSLPSTVKTRYYRALDRLRTVPTCLRRNWMQAG